MTHKPVFWLLLTLGSALCLIFSALFFTRSFPTLERSISMSREQAEQQALARARTLQLAPGLDRSTVRFFHDDDTQNFIELEAGGSARLQQLIQQNIYQVYQWEIRLFRERDPNYTTLFFTPDGQPYGFVCSIAEQQAGAALSSQAALQLAQSRARQDWALDLASTGSPFQLAEQSFVTRPNGRVDHTFVYERNDQRFGQQGEGRVRLRLQVSGDQFSQLRYYLKIPESFSRRYESMRSSNNTIAGIASFAMLALYGAGGCMIGLALLWRQGKVVMRPALIWASLIALLQFADGLNAIPGLWFQYDNAISAQDFLIQRISQTLFGAVFTWLILAVSFMAAESLSRAAFGKLPQFWQLWRHDAAASRLVLGQTVGGYLWVGYDLAFIVGFYYLSQHYLGWWSPAESLIDPDILATPLPWLSPVARALHAGFWEECLFRAVPLAGAALLGDWLQRHYHGRFGTRRSWLLLGLIVQALIFGAAHANYAQQPAYARPLELFIPALVWGLIYLRFGLLPGIIFHFTFDLTLMSLPLFATHASGLESSRATVILIGLLPLLRVLWARWRAGRWLDAGPALFNQAWQATTLASTPAAPPASSHLPANTRARWWLGRALPLLGLVGLLASFALTPPTPPTLPFSLSRAEAEQAAADALRQRGVTLGSQWQHFSTIRYEPGKGHDYIWQSAGPAPYQQLLGRYLPPAVWQVRYIQFGADVVQRAEEWVVNIEQGPDGQGGAPHVRGVVHMLPESSAAASLSVQQARTLALQALQQQFGARASALRELSAQETRHPRRRDWMFTFADDQVSALKDGTARVEVVLAGSELVSLRRTVHIPEQWEREQRSRAAPLQPVRVAVILLLALLGMGSCIMSIKLSAGHTMLGRTIWLAGSGLLLLGLLGQANNWHNIAAQIKTGQPLTQQLAVLLLSLGIVTGLIALLCSLMLALARQIAAQGRLGPAPNWVAGLGLAALLLGARAALQCLAPDHTVAAPSLGMQDTVFPLFGHIAAAVTDVLLKGNLLLLGLTQLQQFNHHFSRRQVATVCILMLLGLGMALGTDQPAAFFIKGLGYGLGLNLLYLLVARFQPKLILQAFLCILLLSHLQPALHAPYPQAPWYALAYGVTLMLCGWCWLRFLQQHESAPRPS